MEANTLYTVAGECMADTPLKRSLRLVAIMELFRQEPHRGFTTEELAQRFNVSVRTIQKDMADLGGDPVYLPVYERKIWVMVKKEGAA